MTVSSTLSRQTFACDGTTRIFTLPFRVLAATEVVGLRITIADNSAAQLTNGVDFTVASVGAANAVVTTTAAYSSLYQVRFIRSTQRLQPTDYRDNDPFPAESHEEALDRLTHIAQELDSITARSVVFPEPESGQTLPASTSRAGQLLGFDSEGELSLVSIPAVDGIIGTTWGSQQIVATAGQTVFDLSSSYVVGTNSLRVTVDGLAQNVGADYTETSTTRVTFTNGLIAGQRVRFDTGRYVTTGVPLASVGKGMAEDTAGGATDEASYHFRRRATYSGGTPGFVNSGLKVSTFVESFIGSGTSSATSYEWGFTSELVNHSGSGENVAINGTARARLGAGPTWGGNLVIEDWSTGNPTTGKVGLEINVDANGTDNNNNRIGLEIAARRRGITGTAMEASFGIRFQQGGDEANSLFKTFIGVNPGTRGVEGVAMHAAVLTGAAFKMAQDQFMAFNATSTRQLTHNGGGFIFKTNVATLWSLNDDGSLFNSSTQILGTRRPGWAAATGTATRTTFATTTVTTEQLAQRVKALIDDLTLHGLIGA